MQHRFQVLAARLRLSFKTKSGVTRFILWAVLSWLNFWIADAFGFIFWEVKENWRLYRANRSPTLGPVSIGPHGETLAGLLQPGFHSGTVPKLYARLRAAERQAIRDGATGAAYAPARRSWPKWRRRSGCSWCAISSPCWTRTPTGASKAAWII